MKRLLLCFALFGLPTLAIARPAHYEGAFSAPRIRPNIPEVPIAEPNFADPAQGGGSPATYFYVATAVDTNGLESSNSNEASATLKQGMTKGVTLTWTAPANPSTPIAGYNIKRATVTGGPYTKLNSSLITGTTYVDPFVAPAAPGGLGATVN